VCHPPMRHLRRLLPYFREHIAQLVGGLALVVLASGITSVIPWILEHAIDSMRDGAPPRTVILLAGGIVGAALVGGAMRYGMRELLNGLSRWVEYDLRNDLFAHLERLDATYFASVRTGDVMARLTNDLAAVRQAAGPAIMYLTNTIFGGIFALAFMSRIDARLTLLALLPMIALPVIAVKMGRLIHVRFESVQEHFSALTTHAQENLSGVRIVRAYRQEESEIERFRALNEEYLTRNMALVRLWGTLHPAFALLAGIGAIIVLGYGGALALRGAISVGAFVAFGMYLAMLTWPLIALGWVINLFQRGDASMGRLADILDARPLLDVALPVQHLPPTNAGRSIEFRNVSFHFPVEAGAAPRWVLHDVSFTIPSGALAGIVGPREAERARSSISSRASTIRSAARSSSMASRSRTSRSTSFGARSASRRRRVSSSATRSRAISRTDCSRAPRPMAGTRRRESRSSTKPPQPSRPATTRCSASAGSISPVGRSSAPHSRAHSRVAPRSSCWTTRSRPWTRTPKPRSCAASRPRSQSERR